MHHYLIADLRAASPASRFQIFKLSTFPSLLSSFRPLGVGSWPFSSGSGESTKLEKEVCELVGLNCVRRDLVEYIVFVKLELAERSIRH